MTIHSLSYFETRLHIADDLPVKWPDAPITTTQAIPGRVTSRQDSQQLRLVANSFLRREAMDAEGSHYERCGVDLRKLNWLANAPRADYQPTTRRKKAA